MRALSSCSIPTPFLPCSPASQSDLGLNIREAHAFNTTDRFSMDVFVVDMFQLEVRALECTCVALLQPSK